MSVFSRFIAVGVPSDANLLERWRRRAWPSHSRYQCTLLASKCEGRRNADVAILLSTPWALHILCPLTTQTLEKHCVSGNRRFGVLHAMSRTGLVIREVGWNWKGRNHNGESRDQKVRTHTLPMRCTERKRVLRRLVSRRRKRRRGNRVSMRPCGMSAHDSAVCASICR